MAAQPAIVQRSHSGTRPAAALAMNNPAETSTTRLSAHSHKGRRSTRRLDEASSRGSVVDRPHRKQINAFSAISVPQWMHVTSCGS